MLNALNRNGGKITNEAWSKIGAFMLIRAVVDVTSVGSVILCRLVFVGVLEEKWLVTFSLQNFTGVALGPNPYNPTNLFAGLCRVPPKFVML